MSNSILTSMNGSHRWSFAQLRDIVLMANGVNPIYAYSVRNAAKFAPGLPAPLSAPAVSAGAAGLLTGTYLYRVRWWDSVTGTISLPSDVASVTLTAQKGTVDISAFSAAALVANPRITHWIIERTTAGGGIYLPVNQTYATVANVSSPDGTAIGTTSYTDNVPDDTINDRDIIDANQSRPPNMQFLFTNQNRMFGGGLPRLTVACTVTNGSANVTTTENTFLASMVGQDLSVKGDTSGKTYKILTFNSVASIDLASNFTGTTQTTTCYIAGARDWIHFSEDGNAEYWGHEEFVGLLSNSLRIGDDGEPLMGGAGLGPAGVLLCKRTRSFLLTYTISPHQYQGDARLIQLPVRRGVVNDLAIKYINGFVYGIDHHGIWRMPTGGMIEEIGAPIAYDFWKNTLNWATSKNWWIRWQPVGRLLLFGVTVGDETYPASAFVWSQDQQKWLGTRPYSLGVTCGIELPDADSRLRSVFITEATDGAKSYGWFDHIGKSAGCLPGTAPFLGTISAVQTALGFTGVDVTGATFPTTGEKLKGVPCTIIRAADDSQETVVCVSSDADTVLFTTTAFTGALPVVGDTLLIGPINAKIMSGRMDCGFPDRKKKFRALWLWLKKKTTCVSLKVKVFIDGKAVVQQPDIDFLTLNQDGVSQVAAKPARTLDPTADNIRHEIPLNNLIGTDIQFEFYSEEAGAPWEISKCKLIYEVEGSTEPRK